MDAPSDLLPGIYEGGLKTWECSVDLASYLSDTSRRHGSIQGKRVVEVSVNRPQSHIGPYVKSLRTIHVDRMRNCTAILATFA